MYQADKRREFKKGLDASGARARRAKGALSLRKKQREELMNKRRQGVDNQTFVGPENKGERSQTLQTMVAQLPTYVNMINSSSSEAQLDGITALRKMLCAQGNPPINEVVATNIIPRVISLVRESNNNPQLQKEGAWTLTNICSGSSEHTRLVASHNTIPMFAQFLSSPHASVREQAVWALGNIAGDCPELRNACIQANILPPLTRIIVHSQRQQKVKRTAAWVIRNLVRGKPGPPLQALEPFVPVISSLLDSDDQNIQYDACWACTYFTQNVKYVSAFLQTPLIDKVVAFIKTQNEKCAIPCLRTIGNITCGSKEETQAIVARGVIQMLVPYISNKDKSVRKWTCWALSNVTAGTKDQITAVLQANLLPHVLRILKSDEFDVKKEAAWVLANATSGNDQHKEFLIKNGAVLALCAMLSCNIPRTLECVMQGLLTMLRFGKKKAAIGGTNMIAHQIAECGGQDKIESLFNSEIVRKSAKLHTRVCKIVDEFFTAGGGETIQGLAAPQTTENGSFGFGVQAGAGAGAPGGFNF